MDHLGILYVTYKPEHRLVLGKPGFIEYDITLEGAGLLVDSVEDEVISAVFHPYPITLRSP